MTKLNDFIFSIDSLTLMSHLLVFIECADTIRIYYHSNTFMAFYKVKFQQKYIICLTLNRMKLPRLKCKVAHPSAISRKTINMKRNVYFLLQAHFLNNIGNKISLRIIQFEFLILTMLARIFSTDNWNIVIRSGNDKTVPRTVTDCICCKHMICF